MRAGRLAAVLLMASTQALAFVHTPVGGHNGEADTYLRVTLGRGKLEPNENPDSAQDASFEIYTVGAGYTAGDLAFLQDLRIGLEISWLASPAEVNDLSRAPVASETCLG